jgi:Reverse transcriptase (RNA-dependent DNA polymerase)
MYISPLSDVISAHQLSYHMFADDIQIFLSFPPDSLSLSLHSLTTCINDIRRWLSSHCLSLNVDKTDFIILGNNAHLKSLPGIITLDLGDISINSSQSVRNLGVHFDSDLSLATHISTIVRSSFYHIKLIHAIRRYIDIESCNTLLHAFVLSRLDFCNSLFTILSIANTNRLQRVQNAAARLVYNLPSRSHVTNLLMSLHWLPIKYRINYKICTLVHKFLSSNCPAYFTDLLSHYYPNRSLRSSNTLLLVTPDHTLSSARSSFAFVAPSVWNTLPLFIRSTVLFSSFKSNLKTHFFSLAFRNA